MRIGVPKEIKTHEYRVGLTPESVSEFVSRGHEVYVERGAGLGIGETDATYESSGAQLVESAEAVFSRSQMIIKVKEPQAEERAFLRRDQILYTYLHLAADRAQLSDLLASGVTSIAYETVTDDSGGLPLLKPMSQVAGRLSVQAGAAALEKPKGGRGILLGGVPGVLPGHVTVIGGGVVGVNAAQMALGLGAETTVLDISLDALESISRWFGGAIKTRYASGLNLMSELALADLVIGAVLIPGAAAPKIVKRSMLSVMKAGSVMVDVAIDQGGCFETSRATTHDDPTYVVDGVVHYCVANMPGAVARTSTYALNNATLSHGLALADKGCRGALLDDRHLRRGLNVFDGKVTHGAVAKAHGLDLVSPETCLGFES